MSKEVFEKLNEVISNAYSPYSKVKVAAAVEYEIDGIRKIDYGVNVENVSYGLTICAERNAIGSAVAKGMTKLSAVYLISNQSHPLTPCGACRQVIAEFADSPKVKIVSQNNEASQTWESQVSELLPSAFNLEDK